MVHTTSATTAPLARRAVLSTLFITSLFAAAPAASAQPAATDAPRLVTVAELEPLLRDGSLVLLHVGDKAEYDAEHLPGARYLEARTLALPPQDGGLTLQVPPPAELETRLEALGISDASRIVVYMGKDWVSPSTRVVFTLDYAGLGARTLLLDGGMPAWKAAGKPVTREVPAAATPGTLSLRPRAAAIADLAWVREHAGKSGSAVVDARLPQFYTGESDNNGRIPRPGHVAGAVSLPFESFVLPDGRFKSLDQLQALFTAAGIAAGTTIATYCHIGQQATVPYMAARLLGYDVKLYDGSYEDWSRTEHAPVKKGTEP
jgi:thiosulfate/3-mercaptopyruvate sulfurtransferase